MSPAQSRQQQRAITLLSLAAFSSAVSARLCDPMLPELARHFVATPEATAQVISGFAVAYGLLQVFFGPLGDRLGKYRLIGLTTLASTLGSVAALLATSLEALVLARVLIGVTAAGIIPLAMAWIGDSVPYAERQATLARFLSGQILGVVGGQFFGGLFADTLGWRWAFAFLSLLYLISGSLVLLEGRRNPLTRPTAPPPGRGSGVLQQGRQVLAVPWARLILATVFLEGLLVFGTLAFVPTYLHQQFGLSLAQAGAILGLFGLGGLSYTFLAKRLLKQLGESGLAQGGGVLLALAWALLAWGPAWGWALPACYVAGLGYYMLHNTLQTHATQMVPAVRGTAVSLFASAFFLGQALGALLAARLYAGAGAFSLFICAMLALPLLAVAFSARLQRKAGETPA
ncbi:MAG: hypothetical protein RIR00_577 [Pseudomonadota bacterium]